jgi:hypothetical protein
MLFDQLVADQDQVTRNFMWVIIQPDPCPTCRQPAERDLAQFERRGPKLRVTCAHCKSVRSLGYQLE